MILKMIFIKFKQIMKNFNNSNNFKFLLKIIMMMNLKNKFKNKMNPLKKFKKHDFFCLLL